MFASMRHGIAFRAGTVLLRRERWRSAAFLLGHATRLAPDHWESHNNLAVAFLKLERWSDAVSAAQRAVSVDPRAVDSHDFLGIALLQMERCDEAMAAYQRALALDPGRYDLYDRMGMVLTRLERWDDVVGVYEAALKLDASRYGAHQRLGIALQRLGRWDAAVAAFRRAIELASNTPAAAGDLAGLRLSLSRAEARRNPSDEESTAMFLHQAESLHSGSADRLRGAMDLLAQAKWDEALSRLSPSNPIGGEHFLRVDPLVRLGRLSEAQTAHRAAVDTGHLMPPLPGLSAVARFEQRSAAFWTEENLGPDVFAVERWLEELTVVPDPAHVVPGPRLLFVFDNDFGELTTVKYFVLGQELGGRATFLLPERLYVHNVDANPGRTQQYSSVEDILRVVDREHSEIVLLCSGYLLGPHLKFTPELLAHLIDELQQRGCRVVTTDPFLGMLSKRDPRALIRFELPPELADRFAGAVSHQWAADALRKSQRAAEEWAWESFSRSEQILRDSYHLYPSFCDIPEEDAGETDARNLSFFNERLLRPEPAAAAARPHWLFVMASADWEIQQLFEGARFVDIVASKLVETLAAGRHPILIAPRAFIDELMPRLPTADGIDLLAHCPFNRFMSLLLSAEHVFYWNVVSHSMLIRLYNQLPVVMFDRGHLVRNATGIYDRIVAWYYQGYRTPFRSHREPLTVATVEGWATDYRRQSARLVERFRRAPTPDQMIANLMDRAQTTTMHTSSR